MNEKTARILTGKSFEQKTLFFSGIPHQSKLFLDFQSNSENIRKFYPENQTDLKNYAAQVLENYKVDRNVLCDVLTETNESFGAGERTFENIGQLREMDCAAIVTGQQAGIFSGAAYTIYKIISAVKLADELKKQNVKVVPVFWIAEEDHDFDEVKSTFVLNREQNLAKSENTPENYRENLPVGFVRFDETVKVATKQLLENLSQTEFTGDIKKMLSETYTTGETFSTAFAKLLTRFFSKYGLIILSPLNVKLKQLCAPIFAEAIEKSGEIISALLARNEELEKKNYQPQVLVTKDSFPFFYQTETGERLPLRSDWENEKIKLRHSKKEFNKSELKKIAQNSPEKLSPNALMRPVVQDYLLPTLCYFGGAAEIAYFAQNSVIYKTLKRPVTPIKHRGSFTVIERKNARTLEKYQLDFKDLFKRRTEIFAEIIEKFINTNTARIFELTQKNINEQLSNLENNLKNVEPTLAVNLETRRRKILWHIGALRKKYHRAETLKNEIAYRRIEDLFNALLPNDALQERTLNFITFLNLYGENFIHWIYESTDADIKEHQILYL